MGGRKKVTFFSKKIASLTLSDSPVQKSDFGVLISSLHTRAPGRESWTLLRGLTGIVHPHLGKINAVTGYGYALDPLRLVGVDKKN